MTNDNLLLVSPQVRGHGYDALGAGFSGEIDLSLLWTHTERLDPPPPPKSHGSALAQLTANGTEDKCKLGHLGELKTFLNSLPLRIIARWTSPASSVSVAPGRSARTPARSPSRTNEAALRVHATSSAVLTARISMQTCEAATHTAGKESSMVRCE